MVIDVKKLRRIIKDINNGKLYVQSQGNSKFYNGESIVRTDLLWEIREVLTEVLRRQNDTTTRNT